MFSEGNQLPAATANDIENTELRERIKALEAIVKDLAANVSRPKDPSTASSTHTIPHSILDPPYTNPLSSADSPSKETTLSNPPITGSPEREIIDLRPSRNRNVLQDDLRCVERLAHADQGHPHVRLGFLWHIVYTWCDGMHDLAMETWLKIIEGSVEGDVWLWEDGDEVFLSNNIRISKAADPEYDAPVFLYTMTLRASIVRLTPGDWNHAMNALQRRLDRKGLGTPTVGEKSKTTASFLRRERIHAHAWLILLSEPMHEADKLRGKRRQLFNVGMESGLLDHWIEIHLLFYSGDRNRTLEINDSDNYCYGLKKWYERKGEWMGYLSMFYSVEEIKDVFNNMGSGLGGCFDGCIERLGY